MPNLKHRKPLNNDLRARNRFNRDHHHPEIPIEPADQKPRPIANARARKIRKGLRSRHRNRHFGQHPHDEQHEKASERITDHHRRADAANRG